MNLGFKDQFVPFVEEGSKTHTIRVGQRWKAGMRADLFARPRQKGMRLLFRAMVTKVERVEIAHRDGLCDDSTGNIWIDGVRLDRSERNLFAWRDGFRHRELLRPTDTVSVVSPETIGCFDLMMDFWHRVHNLSARPFVGQIVHWDYAQRFMEKRREQAA